MYGWKLPDDHVIYKEFKRSVRNVLIHDLLQKILLLKVCKGVGEKITDSSIFNHIIPCDIDFDTFSPVQYEQLKRHKDCLALHEENDKNECYVCRKIILSAEKLSRAKIKNDNAAAN